MCHRHEKRKIPKRKFPKSQTRYPRWAENVWKTMKIGEIDNFSCDSLFLFEVLRYQRETENIHNSEKFKIPTKTGKVKLKNIKYFERSVLMKFPICT